MTDSDSARPKSFHGNEVAASAVALSADEWESLQETFVVLSDQQTIADLQESADNIAEGELCDTDEALEGFEQRRSSPRV